MKKLTSKTSSEMKNGKKKYDSSDEVLVPLDEEVVLKMVHFLDSLKKNSAQKNLELIFDINDLAGDKGIYIDGKGYILPSFGDFQFTGKEILAIYFAAHHYSIPEPEKKFPMAFDREFGFARKIFGAE